MLSPQKIETSLKNGLFFITICTNQRNCIFTEDAADPYCLSVEGKIAKQCWLNIPQHFPHVSLDQFAVLPNHIHGIIGFTGKPAVFVQEFATATAGSLITILKTYKAAVTRQINSLPDYQEFTVWQRGKNDHRIRNKAELQRIQLYISQNPHRWIEKIDE